MSKKIKKLTLQYSYLTLEFEEVREVCEEMESEIRKYMEKNHPDYYKEVFEKEETKDGPSPIEEDELDDHPIDSKTIKNKDVKLLYRKIAARTHPDKTGDNSLADIFDKARKAYDKENVAELLEIAGSLNIELVELSVETLEILKNNIETLSIEINTKKNTAAWYWSKAKSEEDKQRLALLMIKAKGA